MPTPRRTAETLSPPSATGGCARPWLKKESYPNSSRSNSAESWMRRSAFRPTELMAMSERDREAYERAKALWHYQMVRLDHDDIASLRSLAKRKNTTVAELIRMFVTWGLEDGDYRGADKD